MSQANPDIKPDNPSFLVLKKMNGTVLNLALKYLSYRSRTVFEMKSYIQKKGFDKESIEHVLEYLISQNYLNDQQYCKLFLEYRFKYKPKSVFALKYELKSKGVDEFIIDAMISDYNNNELAVNAVKAKIGHWQSFDKDKFNKKVMNFLKYRGFSYSVSISTLNQINDYIRKENED
ncbi:MAG: recombination regulator RecX [Desulfobacula sp.]|nr:recombination regulator RecX [Desulfobacula sp.]